MFARKALAPSALLALTTTACGAPAGQSGSVSKDDVEAIEVIIQEYVQAVLARDVWSPPTRGLAATFAVDDGRGATGRPQGASLSRPR